jgi:hypothetical protein
MMELEVFGMDLAKDDVLHNLVTRESQLMKGTTPSRGSKEKDPLVMQMFIESTTLVSDVVLDCTIAIGIETIPYFSHLY